MARIPDEVVEQIKREVSVQRLAEARGVKLKRQGKNLMGLCPFHKDTNPSLSIDTAKNQWHCLGCGKGGTAIDWVMCAEGISMRHALELLRRDVVPVTAASAGPPPKKCTVPKLPPLIESAVDDKKLLERIVSHYQQTLKDTPDAQQYLVKRGLQSSAMVAHFRLGCANRTLGYALPAGTRIAGAEQRGRLIQLGIYRESGHEHFSGSLVIPIFNLQGEVVQMYGRKLRDDLRQGTPDHLYLPGPMRGVWNEQALIASKEIILCEALIDALTFWCAGYRNVTSIYGVNNFTEEHRAAFRQHGTKRIYIAYDRDDAGERAAQAHAEELMRMGIECFRVQFPKGMDANEYAGKVQQPGKALGVMLRGAAWLGKGKRPAVRVPEIEATEEGRSSERETSSAPDGQSRDARLGALEEAPGKEAGHLAAVSRVSATPAENQQEASAHVKPNSDAVSAAAGAAAKEESSSAVSTSNKAPKTVMVPGIAKENVFPLAAVEEAGRRQEADPPASVRMSGTAAPYMTVEIRGEEVILTEGNRRYRVRGLQKAMSYEQLRVNLMVSSLSVDGFHVDTIDLYKARDRVVFAKLAAEELRGKEETIKRDLQHALMKLEVLQHEQIKRTLQPEEELPQMTAEEQAAATELLRDPRLIERVLADFEKCGVVGEETNKKISYLAAVSRLLEKPLAVVLQSASSAGKSSLMEAVLDFMPEEQREEYTAMTGQALFYMGEKNLKHKILAISEQQGAEAASYPLKLLQSEGKLNIASTGKDPATGKHVTHDYQVEGPVMIFLTTTNHEVDEELLNRCIVLTVSEDREQTRAIHEQQREAQTLEGWKARLRQNKILQLHRNAQRLLRPVAVVIPKEHAKQRPFPDTMTRTRRDHKKFLTLIQSIALLHQRQRETKTSTEEGGTLEYIEATGEDVALAWELTNQALVRSLDDVQPQTRRLLLLIDKMVTGECARLEIERLDYRFTRATVRQFSGWGDSQLKKHLSRLEDLEYLALYRGEPGQSYVYALNFEMDEQGRPVLPGLSYGAKRSRSGEGVSRFPRGVSPSGHGQDTGVSRGGHGEPSPAMARVGSDFYAKDEKHSTRGAEAHGDPRNRVVAASKPNGRANGHAGVK